MHIHKCIFYRKDHCICTVQLFFCQSSQRREIINDINTNVTIVATAIEEQTITTQEISNNVSQAAAGIQIVTENVNQVSSVAGVVTKDIHNVSQSADEMKTGSLQVNESALGLSKLADYLNEMVGRFVLA